MSLLFRRALHADFPEARRITCDAYLRAGHFSANHPYMTVLEDVEQRAQHAQVWVAEAAGQMVAAVTLTFAGQPYTEIAQDGELEFRMLAVDPAHQGGGVGRAVGAPNRGARPRAARHRGDQHHQRHVHGTCPQPVQVHGLPPRPPERDWHVPGEDVLLWVFTLELAG